MCCRWSDSHGDGFGCYSNDPKSIWQKSAEKAQFGCLLSHLRHWVRFHPDVVYGLVPVIFLLVTATAYCIESPSDTIVLAIWAVGT